MNERLKEKKGVSLLALAVGVSVFLLVLLILFNGFRDTIFEGDQTFIEQVYHERMQKSI